MPVPCLVSTKPQGGLGVEKKNRNPGSKSLTKLRLGKVVGWLITIISTRVFYIFSRAKKVVVLFLGGISENHQRWEELKGFFGGYIAFS